MRVRRAPTQGRVAQQLPPLQAGVQTPVHRALLGKTDPRAERSLQVEVHPRVPPRGGREARSLGLEKNCRSVRCGRPCRTKFHVVRRRVCRKKFPLTCVRRCHKAQAVCVRYSIFRYHTFCPALRCSDPFFRGPRRAPPRFVSSSRAPSLSARPLPGAVGNFRAEASDFSITLKKSAFRKYHSLLVPGFVLEKAETCRSHRMCAHNGLFLDHCD